MIVPPVSHRREIDRKLVEFFHSHRIAPFRRAVSDICAYYHVRTPRIEWYEYIDWGKTAGKTYEDGRIHLIHPENWKRGRVYNSERMWIHTLYHEMGHYLFWTDAERKANTFQCRMVRGLRPPARRARMSLASRRRPFQRAGKRRIRVATGRRKRRA